MNNLIVTIDVREDIAAGREPLSRISDAVSLLREGESLKVIAPFEPRPLINLLAMQGFTAKATQTESGEWEAVFSPAEPADEDEW